MFANFLSSKTDSARSVLEEATDEIMNAFKRQCIERAEKGLAYCIYTCDDELQVPKEIKYIMESKMQTKLKQNGFICFSFRFVSVKKKKMVRISGHWSMKPKSQPKSNVKKRCPICFDDTYVSALVPCGHLFCHSCLKFDKCPICRQNISSTLSLFESWVVRVFITTK